jgi:hypothetical protein
MKLKRHIDATLGSGNLREVVRLPVGEDLNEWLAVNSKFFESHFALNSCCLALQRMPDGIAIYL